MTPIVITYSEIEEAKTSGKKLYWLDDENGVTPENYDINTELLENELDCVYDFAYDWGSAYNHNIQGNHVLKDLLHSLIEEANLAYFRDYTEEELFDEVADDWESLNTYLFCRGEVKTEDLKKAYKQGRNDEPLENILTTLMRKQVTKIVCKGYSQGEYAEVYVAAEQGEAIVDEEQKYVKALLEAYLFGCYTRLDLVDDEGEYVAEACVTDYFPTELKGKPYDEWKAYAKKCFLEELELEEKDIVGVAKPYKTIEFNFEEK